MKCFDPLCLQQKIFLQKSILGSTRRCRSKPRYNKPVLRTFESQSKKKNSSTPTRNSIRHLSWSAGFRRRLEKMTSELLEQAKSEVFSKLQVVKQPDGFHKVSRALFAFGTKPAQ